MVLMAVDSQFLQEGLEKIDWRERERERERKRQTDRDRDRESELE